MVSTPPLAHFSSSMKWLYAKHWIYFILQVRTYYVSGDYARGSHVISSSHNTLREGPCPSTLPSRKLSLREVKRPAQSHNSYICPFPWFPLYHLHAPCALGGQAVHIPTNDSSSRSFWLGLAKGNTTRKLEERRRGCSQDVFLLAPTLCGHNRWPGRSCDKVPSPTRPPFSRVWPPLLPLASSGEGAGKVLPCQHPQVLHSSWWIPSPCLCIACKQSLHSTLFKNM